MRGTEGPARGTEGRVREQRALLIVENAFNWKKGKDPHPQDKIQHLDFTKDPRPLYYKTPPCAFYHRNVCSKAVFGLSKDEIGPQ